MANLPSTPPPADHPSAAALPSCPADPLAGTSYERLERLTEGGSSDILLARHRVLGKRVVVKLLRRALGGDPLFVERMRLEARALGHLEHPNIAAVSDFGHTADGRPFLVLEHLHGRTLLAEIRQRGHLPVEEAVAVMLQLLDGLAAAHALGIVHRDLKLENLFLCEPVEGRRVLKILDFGLAKVLPGADAERAPAPLALASREGAVLGTPQFLSPEQALCRPVDERTDIYGAGMVLYELITGRAAFRGINGLVQLLKAHVSRMPPPPSSVAPQPIEPAIEDVVLRAIAKRPEDRYASASELAGALRRALAMQPVTTDPPECAPPAPRSEPARDPNGPMHVTVARSPLLRARRSLTVIVLAAFFVLAIVLVEVAR